MNKSTRIGLSCPDYSGHWLKGSFPEYSLDPVNFYRNVWKARGDFSRIRMTATRAQYLLVHPDAVEHLLKTRYENYEKPKERKILFDGSLLMNQKSEVRQIRSVMQPCYSSTRSASKCPAFLESADRFIREISSQPEKPVHLYEKMVRLCLEVASISLFSRDLSVPELEFDAKIRTCLFYANQVSERTFTSARLPWSRLQSEFLKARADVNFEIDDIIRQHKEGDEPPSDILSEVIKRAPADFNIHENSFLLLLASYITMSDTLHFGFQQLAANQALQYDVRDEIESALGGRCPSAEDLSALPLTEAVFKESMRLFSNFNLFQIAKEEDEVCGYRIPAGSRVCLSQFVTHRHPDFWDDPEHFHPERFLSPDVLKHKFSYFPFGGGPRICVGKTLAMMEGPILLARILQSFRIESADAHGGAFYFHPHS
jgi:cytochrome P450